jgi:phosphoserine aminotransferase
MIKAIFNAGPSALPLSAFDWLRKQLPDSEDPARRFESILEIGHRTPAFIDKILEPLKDNLRTIYNLGDEFEICFLQGGANFLFGMLPLNLRHFDQPPGYVVSGRWSQRAFEDATRVMKAQLLWSGEKSAFVSLPDVDSLGDLNSYSYVYLTSNETVQGVQARSDYQQRFECQNLVLDITSDILSTRIDLSKVALAFASVQKNMGISGLAVVFVRKDFLSQMRTDGLPRMLDLNLMVEENSCFNTPPVLTVAMAKFFTEWFLDRFKTLETAEEYSKQKAEALYSVIDTSGGFYSCPIEPESRSYMNIVFRIHDPALETVFIQEASKAGYVGLKGHKSAGGLRASIYNAITLEQVQEFAEFLESFARHRA